MDLLRGVNIYLVGMMGVGKTTVGRILARELKYRFFDTDELIVRVANQSIAEIFERDGEEAFRELETKVLGELCAYQNSVVATGGGIVTRSSNWGKMHYGIVVWLDVSVDRLYDRLRSDTARPLLREGELKSKLQSLLSDRERFYTQADVRVCIPGNEKAQEVALRAIDEIQKAIESKTAQDIN